MRFITILIVFADVAGGDVVVVFGGRGFLVGVLAAPLAVPSAAATVRDHVPAEVVAMVLV